MLPSQIPNFRKYYYTIIIIIIIIDKHSTIGATEYISIIAN